MLSIVSVWSAYFSFFFFQAEDGIRDLVRSRGLGDVYKRQMYGISKYMCWRMVHISYCYAYTVYTCSVGSGKFVVVNLSLIHI